MEDRALRHCPAPCPLCGGTMWQRLFPVEMCDIYRCDGCTLLVTGPSLDAAGIAGLYQQGYYEKGAKRFRMSFADRIMQWFRRSRARKVNRLLGKPSKILDIGCGRGFTLATLRNMGHEVHGTQLSHEAAAFARDHLKLEHIEEKDVAEIGYPDASFDAVTIYHVLEHVPDPAAMLKEIARILKPGGLLIVEVPHAGGWGAVHTGRFWLGWDVPHHRFHFTQETLGRALTDASFRVERWSFPTIEYSPAVLVQSYLNEITGTENQLFRSVSYAGASSLRKRPVAMVAHLVIAAILVIPALLLSILGSMVKRGEIVAAQCRRA